MIFVFQLIAALSLCLNAYLFYRLRKAFKSPVKSIEAQDLLHDLTRRGRAVLDVKVLDPDGLFITRGSR